MGSHTRPRSKRSVPALVLGITVVSAGSPLAILALEPPVMAVGTVVDEQAFSDLYPSTTELFSGSAIASKPKRAVTMAMVKSTRTPTPTPIKPTTAKVVTKTATKTNTATRKRIPTSTPVPTVTTRPTRPTVAQRQVQSLTRATLTASPKKPVPEVAPKAQTTIKTTTKPPPPTATTAPKPKLTTTAPKITPTSAPTHTTTATSSSKSMSKVVSVAMKYVGRGIPYVMGGNSLTEGMDCSHFVWMVLKESGYSVGYRSSSSLASWTKRVTNPVPGDLVLYKGHVGIYAGNGKMIHHGRDGGAFFVPVYKDNFIGYGRMPL